VARQNKLQGRLGTRATDMYRTGQLGFIEVLVGSNSFEEFASNWDLLRSMNDNDASMVSDVKDVRGQVTKTRNDLKIQRADAARQLKIRRQARRYVESQLAKRKTLLHGIQGEIAKLEAEEQARAAAAAAAAAANGGGGSGYSQNFPTPSIPAHGNVLDYAKSRLGCPYEWAASGPNAFDCSGLAMWCYAQIGISLPHSSSEQINVGQRVSQGDLQPGDLVFFGSPIHHVGMYVGGDNFIEAPYTGENVRIARYSSRGDHAGACRPTE
jgi:cell wall-associated NlpC family hydrolase